MATKRRKPKTSRRRRSRGMNGLGATEQEHRKHASKAYEKAVDYFDKGASALYKSACVTGFRNYTWGETYHGRFIAEAADISLYDEQIKPMRSDLSKKSERLKENLINRCLKK